MLFYYILYKNIFIFFPSHSYLIPTTFSSCPPVQRRRRAAGGEGEVGRGGDELEEEEEGWLMVMERGWLGVGGGDRKGWKWMLVEKVVKEVEVGRRR